MPRQARLEIPGIPLHLTQREVNRCAIFLADDDRRHYIDLLTASTLRHELRPHAYVLMGNHVHLLVSADQLGEISRAMRQLGQAYVTAFNRRPCRTGTPLQSSLVDSDGYLLTAYRYIELNPVKAAMVEAVALPLVKRARESGASPRPADHASPQLCQRGRNPAGARANTYREWLKQGVSDDELIAIRKHLQQERA